LLLIEIHRISTEIDRNNLMDKLLTMLYWKGEKIWLGKLKE